MKKKIIFLTQTSGHHIEYLNHIFNEVGDFTDNQYIFIVPESFHQNQDKFIWKENSNTSFVFFKDKEVSDCSKNIIIRSFQYNQLLRKKIKDIDSKDIFLIELMKFLPFSPFFFQKDFNISGIIYQIYLYKLKQLSFVNKRLNIFKFLIFRHFSCFKYVYVLNDKFAFKYFNKIYKTEKFKYLSDPIIPIKINNNMDLRESLGIGLKEQVVLHFGAMTETKGTLKILDFLNEASEIELEKKVFVFAGVVKSDIKKEFYKLIEELNGKCRIFVFDDFVDFDFTASLFNSSDVVFCPYQRVYQSSGVIGYCVQFNKPVIVPNQGLLGKLVRNNKIGITYEKFESQIIFDALLKAKKYRISNNYLTHHTIEEFSSTILKSI